MNNDILGGLFGGSGYSGGMTKKDIFKSLIRAYNSERQKAVDCGDGPLADIHKAIASMLLSLSSDFYDPSFNE